MEDVAAKTLDQIRLLRALVNFNTQTPSNGDSGDLENQRDQISRCVRRLEEHFELLFQKTEYRNGQTNHVVPPPAAPEEDVITPFLRQALPEESQRVWRPNSFTGSLLVFFVDGKIDSGSLIEKKLEPLDTDLFWDHDTDKPALNGNGVEFHIEPFESFSVLKTQNKKRVNICFKLDKATSVTIQVLDSKNRVIRSFQRDFDSPGDYRQEWDGRDESGNIVPDAQYQCQLKIGDSVTESKTILL